MKGLDTPILLEILEGRPSARKLVEGLRGVEVCTTEANVAELHLIARALGGPGVAARLAAVERLRRGLTVLPLDAKATSTAAELVKDPRGVGALQALVLGALAASGCSEWITSRTESYPVGMRKPKITQISS